MFRLSDTESHTTPPTAVVGGVMDGVAPPVCTITVRRYRRWSAVMLRGELDRQSAEEVSAVVTTECELDRPVIVELVGVDSSDVNGLLALAGLVRRSQESSKRPGIEVHGARGDVVRLISELGLEELMTPASDA